jgi:hypothetical protein
MSRTLSIVNRLADIDNDSPAEFHNVLSTVSDCNINLACTS